VKMLMRSPSHFDTFTDDEPAVSITALPCTQIVLFTNGDCIHTTDFEATEC